MSCDAIVSAAFLWLAATNPIPAATSAAPAASVAQEPLFVDIVSRAGKLKAEVQAFRGESGAVPNAFQQQIADLSALDMKAHVTLKERGADGDLKCILKGISEDLPLKLAALVSATTPAARDAAVIDLAYLLNDNVEVITAPPAAPV